MNARSATSAAQQTGGLNTWAKVAIVCVVLLIVLIIAIFVALLWGSQPKGLTSYYGRHRVSDLPPSVNGTDVLAGMFREAGHDVHFRGRIISSEMSDADTIVWFPDDFAAPTEEVCNWFDDWLAEYPGRTAVFVGRDFNAAPHYWQVMLEYQRKKSAAGDAKKQPLDTKVRTAKADHEKPGKDSPDKTSPETTSQAANLKDEQKSCEWFSYKPEPLVPVKSLDGPWARGIDAAKANISLGTQIQPDGALDELLSTNDHTLVAQLNWPYWDGSQLVLVANGSFLLNETLVNHEHRKLAGRLIDAVGESGSVVFLESGPGGPPIDPPYEDASLWTLFGAWPLNLVLLQLAAVGIIFCFARWPIFGRPRRPPEDATADFSKHVAAVGQMLSRTRDRSILDGAAAGAAPQTLAAAQKSTLSPSGQPVPVVPQETKGN